jgi:hypothetical protein
MYYGIYFKLQKDKKVYEWYRKPIDEGTAIRFKEHTKIARWVVAHRNKCYDDYVKFKKTTTEQRFQRLTEEGINSSDPLLRNVCRSIAGLPLHGEGVVSAQEYHQEKARQEAESRERYNKLTPEERTRYVENLQRRVEELRKKVNAYATAKEREPIPD